jgi:hypothetical protein
MIKGIFVFNNHGKVRVCGQAIDATVLPYAPLSARLQSTPCPCLAIWVHLASWCCWLKLTADFAFLWGAASAVQVLQPNHRV